MDDIFGLIVAALLIGGIGWIIGIVGFFKANRALAEVTTLRGQMSVTVAPAAPRASVPATPVALPDMPPTPFLEPVAMAAEIVDTPPPRPRRDLEELLTAKWGVWLGAAALLLAGVFLVRYASDEGLLGPGVRCAGMVLLALALVAGGEWLRRHPPGGGDLADYAPQAMAAGGVGMLMGAAYMAGVQYEMVSPPFAFALMAAASLAGLMLSLRFGQLVAAIGIVGAFVTPLLIDTPDPSLPGLFAYLFCVTAAALAVVRYAAWIWLGWATTIAGAAWVLLATLTIGGTDVWAVALFVPAAALLNLALLPGAALDHAVGRKLAWVPVAALGAAGLLLAFAVPEFSTRAGVLLLAPITIGKAAREPRLDRLPWLAASLFLLLTLGWGLPEWQPTGEAITTEGVIQAILPGDWTPEILRPLLATTAFIAALFAAAGLWFERRAPHPLRWSALVAAVPVLALAILYVRVKQFQPDFLWAGAALALAAASTLAATQSARERQRQRAAVHATGATAALALGFAMLLTGQWLTMAFALFLPALAWIESRAKLPALRHVAMAVAALALARLLANPNVLDYATGESPVLNDLLPVYFVATLSFAVTARMFQRGADDLVVAVLELGSVAFASAWVILEIRHWATGGMPGLPDSGFREAALQVSAMSILALMSQHLEARTGRPVLDWAWRIQGALALAGAVLLILGNPAFVASTTVGVRPVVNALLPAYVVPAVLALLALRRPSLPASLRPVLLGYVLVAGFAWITLEVRHAFHPDAMALADAPIEDGELWSWSGAWMAYGLSLMAIGVATGGRRCGWPRWRSWRWRAPRCSWSTWRAWSDCGGCCPSSALGSR